MKGEPLGVVSNWPPALQAALARWGATQGKSPALTTLDITGKPLYTLTYGKNQLFTHETTESRIKAAVADFFPKSGQCNV